MSETKKRDVNLAICVVFGAIAIIFNIIAFVTPYWIVVRPGFPSKFVRLGLWEACFDGYIHPEDYVSKQYFGCWYVYWPEYNYIRDWLNPPWFYAAQMMASLSLICNGGALGLMLLKLVDVKSPKDKITNVLAIILQLVAIGCYVIVIVSMGVMSKDREWLPRPDHNQVSWSFAFMVLGGFFTIFSFFNIVLHYVANSWIPNVKVPVDKQYSELQMVPDNGMKTYKSQSGSVSGMRAGGGLASTIYSQGMKPKAMIGTTSAATASAKVREAMSQKQKNQYGSAVSLNSMNQMKNRTGSSHSLASMGRPQQHPQDFRGSMSSLHSNNKPRSQMSYGEGSVV